MPKFQIWYAKGFGYEGIKAKKFDLATLQETHALVREIEVDDLGGVYMQMQGEIWSPNGEARPLIESLGLNHTSMMIGDIAVAEDNIAYLCDTMSWENLGEVPEDQRKTA